MVLGLCRLYYYFETKDGNSRRVGIFSGPFFCFWSYVRFQKVVDKFGKKLRDTFSNVRSFIYHFSRKSQNTILCTS